MKQGHKKLSVLPSDDGGDVKLSYDNTHLVKSFDEKLPSRFDLLMLRTNTSQLQLAFLSLPLGKAIRFFCNWNLTPKKSGRDIDTLCLVT